MNFQRFLKFAYRVRNLAKEITENKKEEKRFLLCGGFVVFGTTARLVHMV